MSFFSTTLLYMECSQKAPEVPDFKLMEHQSQVIDYFLKSPHRGMILYHGLGAGKTVTSLTFALEYLKSISNPSEHRVWILTPGSLRFNFIREYCRFYGLTKYSDRFSFLSYNYSKLKNYIDRYNFDNSIIIVDEFHNLINGARNGSINYVMIYKKIMYAKNAKILLLSGTPLIYYPYEISLAYNLVKEDAFPIDPREFSKLCRIEKNKLIIPKKKQFKESMTNVLSYIPNLGLEHYPKVINGKATKVMLTKYQVPYYIQRRLKEIRMAFGDSKAPKEVNIFRADFQSKQMSPSKYIAFSMILSRQVGNFCYPKIYQENLMSTNFWDRQAVPDDDEIIDIKLSQLKTKYSPKFYILLKRIQELEGKHLVYTQFLNRHGVKLLQQLMKLAGITSLAYTGNLGTDEERNFVLDSYNAPDNLNGEKVKVLCTTAAGTQGLTTKETNYVHILEPHRSEMFIQQLIGRAVRYQSHERIKDQRNFVKVYRYYTILPKDLDPVSIDHKIKKDGKTKTQTITFDDKESADLMIKKKADQTHRAILPLLQIMKETAIDCEENYGKKCYVSSKSQRSKSQRSKKN